MFYAGRGEKKIYRDRDWDGIIFLNFEILELIIMKLKIVDFSFEVDKTFKISHIKHARIFSKEAILPFEISTIAFDSKYSHY